jgi:hypothetical protein
VESGRSLHTNKVPKIEPDPGFEAISPSGALAGYYIEGSKEYGFMYSGGTYTRLRAYPASS